MFSYILNLEGLLHSFISCPLREEVERRLDEREHETEILAEVAELQTEAVEDYERKVVEYRRHLEEWRSWRRKQVPLLHHYYFSSVKKDESTVRVDILNELTFLCNYKF